MDRPTALLKRTTQELRALLRPGSTIKGEELKDIAKFAIAREIEDRSEELAEVNGLVVSYEQLDQMEKSAQEEIIKLQADVTRYHESAVRANEVMELTMAKLEESIL